MTRRRIALPALIAAAAVALGLILLRRPPPPAPAAPGGPPAPARFVAGEELRYEFGWNDVPAAVVVLRTALREREGARLGVLSYEVATTEALERIWAFRAEGETLLDPQRLRPHVARYRSASPGREKAVLTRFDWDAGLAHVSVTKKQDEEVKTKEATVGAGLDLGAAFLMLRFGELPAGERARHRVLSGDDAYEAVIAPAGAESVRTPAGRFEATRYELRFRKLDEGERDKERTGHVWVSRDGHLPVRFECRVPVGRVYAELVERRAPGG